MADAEVLAPRAEVITDEALDARPAEETPAAKPEEVVVTIGEGSPASTDDQPAPQWVKDLRKENRELKRQAREREQAQAAQVVNALGQKPTMESCDFDAEKFGSELEQWHEKKRAHDATAEKERKAQETQQTEWQAKLTTYAQQKAELNVEDFEEAEHNVAQAFSLDQQAVMLDSVKNSATVVAALGNAPAKLKELAAISNFIKFAIALRDLESELKVTPRKSVPAPESRVVSNGSTAGANTQLEKLRAEADRTGDRTKVAAYMQQMKRSK